MTRLSMIQILITDNIHNIAALLCFRTISFSEDADAVSVRETNTTTTQMKVNERGNMVIVVDDEICSCKIMKVHSL